MKRDPYDLILDTLQNPTKLSIVFLLFRNQKMTVTQMSKHIGVSKANLYHFVSQMASDGLLSKPEAQIKRNYVEKYYRLNWGIFASIDPSEQKKRLRDAKPLQQKTVLQSFLASLGLHFRLFAEEIASANDRMLSKISDSFARQQINLSYMVLPDETYKRTIGEVNRLVKSVTETWRNERHAFRGNRMIIVGLPQLEEETGVTRPRKGVRAGTTGTQ